MWAMYNDELYFGESRGRDTVGKCDDSYEEDVTGFVLNKMANSLGQGAEYLWFAITISNNDNGFL